MQICRSLAIFCARLFCCIPTQSSQVPSSPSSQQRMALVVTNLHIQKKAEEILEFFQDSSKTRVDLYDCTLTFLDGASHSAQVTSHRISQLIVKFGLNSENSSLQNDVEEAFFTESLVAESVLEPESPETWLRSIHGAFLPSPSMPSLERMDASQEGIKLETIRED